MSSKRNKVWSITARLALLYTLSAFALLSFVTGFSYWLLVSRMGREHRLFLLDEVRILRVILRDHSEDPDALDEEVQWEGSARRYNRFFARVLDAGGLTLMETSHMSGRIPSSAFPPPAGVSQMPSQDFLWKSPDGRSYWLMTAWAVSGRDDEEVTAGRRQLQLALDVSDEQMLIASYRRNLALVLFAGVVLSSLAGIIVARRGMRPLEKIAEATQQITASRLHQRMGLERWPKELRVLATSFDEMLHRLEDSFNRLSQFSADLAHELRTPINNLVGEAEVALSRARTSEEYRQVLASSLEEYEKLSHMIKNLLFLARSDSTEGQITKTFLDARKEIGAVLEFHEAVAEEQKVRITCKGDAMIHVDSPLFRRAVSNLLSNALQYTPSGGEIKITVESADGQAAEVRVQDSGSGIEPKDLPKIFDRFYRGDPSRSKSREGTGLGLAIVKSIMDLHGGTVSVESRPAGGTTVSLSFPL